MPAAAQAQQLAAAATDPVADGSLLVWHAPGAGGRLARGGTVRALPGWDPAAGGGLLAWRREGRIEVAPADSLEVQTAIRAPGAEKLAVSATRLAWLDGGGARPTIAIGDPRGRSAPQTLYVAPTADAQLGRPSLDGDVLVFHQSTPRSSRLVEIDLATGSRRELVAPAGTLVLQPSVLSGSVAFVRASYRRQELVLISRERPREVVLWSTEPTARRDRGRERGRHRHRAGYPRRRAPRLWRRPKPGVVATLWTTAVAPEAAYVTRLRHRRGGATAAEILAVARPADARTRRSELSWIAR